MFETTVGPVKSEGSTVYLRPETAQGIFLNFKHYLQFARKRPPFGIAQIGKSFRNEITPGNFIFRMREFEQMEMEFFVPPNDAQRWYEHWLEQRMSWYTKLGIRADHLRLRAHDADELSHYSSAHQRRRVPVPDRLAGARGHRQPRRLRPHSARDLLGPEARVRRHRHRRALRPPRDRAGGRRRPRRRWRSCVDAYDEDEIDGEPRTVLRLHPQLAPVKAAILPLVRKDGQPELAREIELDLRERMQVEYDSGGAIGRRYRRQDEIGTPWAVTVDHQSLEDRTVTVRDRDSLAQVRVPIGELGEELERRLRAPWQSPKLEA